MDSLIEGLVRGLARAVGNIFSHIFCELVFYYIGWPFVKVLTLGRYPKGRTRHGWKSESYEGIWTSCVGVMAVVLGGLFYLSSAGYM